MIKSHYFPDKEYTSKEELFKDLKENLEFIILGIFNPSLSMILTESS